MTKPKPFTVAHAIGFIFNAFAHATDGEQTAEEIVAVVNSLNDFNCNKDQIAEIYDWYSDIHRLGEEEMKKTLHNCIGIVETFLKEKDPRKIVTKHFIDKLVDIANADGVIKDSEKAWLTNFCKILDIKEPNILKENNIKSDSQEGQDISVSNAAHMALSYKNRSEEENKFLSKFILKWMAETEQFANLISRIQFPTFLQDLDNLCPVLSDEEITFINHHIKYEKCIPSLQYIHDPIFYHHTKQVWWLVPCVYWGERLVSWIIIDKNGFYAPHPDEWDDQDNVSAIFSWEQIENISFDIKEEENCHIAVLNIESVNGGELTFYELLKADYEASKMEGYTICRGSYLSVIKSIFDVNHPNILESRGAHSWNHGVGDEGFQGFETSEQLLNQSHWQAARKNRLNYKTQERFDYIPEEEK